MHGAPGSIPGQGTRSHMSQLKILHATTKTPCSQKYIYIKEKKKNVREIRGFLFLIASRNRLLTQGSMPFPLGRRRRARGSEDLGQIAI